MSNHTGNFVEGVALLSAVLGKTILLTMVPASQNSLEGFIHSLGT